MLFHFNNSSSHCFSKAVPKLILLTVKHVCIISNLNVCPFVLIPAFSLNFSISLSLLACFPAVSPETIVPSPRASIHTAPYQRWSNHSHAATLAKSTWDNTSLFWEQCDAKATLDCAARALLALLAWMPLQTPADLSHKLNSSQPQQTQMISPHLALLVKVVLTTSSDVRIHQWSYLCHPRHTYREFLHFLPIFGGA